MDRPARHCEEDTGGQHFSSLGYVKLEAPSPSRGGGAIVEHSRSPSQVRATLGEARGGGESYVQGV
jgi:hypothetical protein